MDGVSHGSVVCHTKAQREAAHGAEGERILQAGQQQVWPATLHPAIHGRGGGSLGPLFARVLPIVYIRLNAAGPRVQLQKRAPRDALICDVGAVSAARRVLDDLGASRL